jgi:catechol 2,3-dioxygenase-like lactoylglutathione lyase family enzyme
LTRRPRRRDPPLDARRRSHRGECARLEPRAGETKLGVYESKTAGQSKHTLASFVVDDVRSVVDELKAKGVTFEEYDMPGMKTEDGVAAMGDTRAAWLKDPDGNILEIVGG